MKINLRGRRAYLYRRRWVPAGPDVPHAHPAEDYLGAIDADAETIPPELLTVLTAAEQAQLREKVLLPATQARAAAAKRAQDPMWRIAEASRLLTEAAHCSQSALVPGSSLNVPYRHHFRVTLLPEAEMMREVFARIDRALSRRAEAVAKVVPIKSKSRPAAA